MANSLQLDRELTPHLLREKPKPLLRFDCVSKSWVNVETDERFWKAA